MPQAITAGRELELNLLKDWREPVSFKRIVRDGVVSIVAHLFAGAILFGIASIPATPLRNGSAFVPDLRRAIPLYVPRELTQRAPNEGEVTHNVDVESSVPTPAPHRPRFHAPAPAPGPIAQIQQPAAIEPPKIELPGTQTPAMGLPQQLPIPPAPPPADRPKIVLENVGDPEPHPVQLDPKLQLPKDAVAAATRAAERPGGGALGYDGEGQNTAMQIPQLLSDPSGVDFRPYLQSIARAVKANWLKVLPRGLRGVVSVQFIIDREGRVVKVVIASPSLTPAFDRFAIDGISRVGQFPPLPSDFKGNTISLQITFSSH